MPTTTEYGTDVQASVRHSFSAENDDFLRRKGWLASLLLWRGAAPPPLPSFYWRLMTLPRRARRRLGRKWAAALVGAALLFSAGRAPAAYAATITVDGVRCTLANAIRAANTDSVVGRCRAGSGADVIALRTNVKLTAPAGYYYFDPTGLPLVTSKITIEGNNRAIRRDPADPDQFRLLAVSPTGDLTINSTTLSGGYGYFGGGVYNSGVLTVNNSAITGNAASYGAGVYSYGLSGPSTTTINNSTISGNSGEGIHSDFGSTTTINNSTISGNGWTGLAALGNSSLTVNNSIISENNNAGLLTESSMLTVESSIISGNMGSGIDIRYGETTINNSTLTANSGRGIVNRYGTTAINSSEISVNSGGGIFAFYAGTTITNSTITNNTAGGRGGGIYNLDSDLIIEKSTISGNSAGGGGGGIATIEDYSDLTITNSTVSGNSTANAGGGVFIHEGETTIINSTLTANTANLTGGGLNNNGIVTLIRALISGNAAPTGREVYNIPSSNPFNADAFNLFGFSGDAGAFGFTPGLSDVVPAEPLSAILAALADNGGPTQTHALVPGSPAIDLAPSADCAAPPVNGIDQRGQPRNVDGDGMPSSNECDVGSFELQPGD